MESENKSLDLLGVKPIADAVSKITDGSVKGASAFLSRLCLPAAEEFGLLLKDHVSEWRKRNAVKLAQKTEKLLEGRENPHLLSAPPRAFFKALETGSWEESDEMQDIWAGLLASSCTENGEDDSNLLFMNVVSQLTRSQAKIITALCENSKVSVSPAGWIFAREIEISIEQLRKVTGIENDDHRIDRELDHLRSIELISKGFYPDSTVARTVVTTFCLQLFVRTKGYVGSAIEYFDAKMLTEEEMSNLSMTAEKFVI